MIAFINRLILGSLRRQLISVLSPVLILLFGGLVYTIVQIQQDFLVEAETNKVVAIGNSIATSSSIWLQANDFSAIQQIVDSQVNTKDIEALIVTNPDGLTVAHSDPSKKGLYITGGIKFPTDQSLKIISQSLWHIDVLVPCKVGDSLEGWVLIVVSPKAIQGLIKNTFQFGLLFTGLGSVLSIVILIFFITKLTHRLSVVTDVAKSVSKGDTSRRIMLTGNDEAAQVARELDAMLDSLSIAQDKLKESEERLNFAFEGSGDGMWDWSVKEGTVYFSKQWKAMLGFEDWEISDKLEEWEKRIHPEDKTLVYADIDKYFKKESDVYVNEHRVLCKDGSYKWILDRGMAVSWDENGKPLRMLGTHTDITQRHQVTEALKQAKNLAEQATLAKSAFLANMSHEIRTPMNAILGFSELICQTDLNNAQLDYIRKIKSASVTLLSIINDILDLSKIEAGKLTIDHTSFDIKQTMDNILELFSHRVDDKQIALDLVFDTSEFPRYVKSDPLRFKQILSNLIGNAIKFTDKGKVTVALSIKEKIETGWMVQVEVCDSGIGMSEDTISKLFEPFNQADVSITRKFGGTGLGLTISKNFVELMGGHISVASTPKVGSKFTFTFKADCPTEDEIRQVKEQDELAKHSTTYTSKNKFRGLSVLLAEDNVLNQQVATEFLKSLGCIVVVTDNGKECIRALHNLAHVDVILMDLQMPIMDGFTATALIKKDPNFSHNPILAMTAAAMQHDKAECLERGMDGHIAKPINPKELMMALEPYAKKENLPVEDETTSSEIGTDDTFYHTPAMPDSAESVSWEELNVVLPDFEFNNLKTMLGKNTGLFISMMALFETDFSRDYPIILQHLESNQLIEAEKLLHLYKGSIGNMGGLKTYNAFQALDLELKANTYKAETLDTFNKAATEVLDLCKNLRHKYGKP